MGPISRVVRSAFGRMAKERERERRQLKGQHNGKMRECSSPEATEDDFPYRAVIILALAFTLNSYTLVNIFPYIGLMTADLLKLDSTNEAGYYAGYVASAFTFGRLLTGYGLGLASDRFGRKPIIVLGLASTAVTSLSFGLAPSYGWAVASRLVLGLTNGLVAAARASVREVCGRKHVVMGMTFAAGMRGIALVLGTGVGGILAEPALHFPNTFSSTGLFGRYPFLLPNLVGSGLALLTLVLVIFYLPETKDYRDSDAVKGGDRSNGEAGGTATAYKSIGADDGDAEEGVDSSAPAAVEDEPSGIFGRNGLLTSPVVLAVLLIGALFQFILIGFDESFPLWALSTEDVGGLGWGSSEIARVFLTSGLILAGLQLFAFPAIIRAIGLKTWQHIGWVFGLVGFLAVPSCKFFSWDDDSLLVACIVSVLFVSTANASIGVAMMVASTNVGPPHLRGTLAGIYLTAESLGRSTGPAGFATMYAYSISSRAQRLPLMDYHFVFYLSFVILLVIGVLCWVTLTPDILGKRRPDDAGDEEESVPVLEVADKVESQPS